MPMRQKNACSEVSVLGLVLLVASISWGAVAGLPVKEIRIMGVSPRKARTIQGILLTKINQPYSPADIETDIKRLWERGFFCTDVRAEDLDGGVRLIYTIQENPLVSSVRFRGRVRADELKKIIITREGQHIFVGSLIDPAKVGQIKGDARRIKKYFLDRGYRDVMVTPSVQRVGRTVAVTFDIRLGPKVRLKSIEFVGNKAFLPKELKRLMQTKVDKWYTSSGFNEDILRQDLERIESFYRFKGFPDATVTLEKLEYRGSKKDRAYATVRIQEGERYRVASLSFFGNRAIAEKELLKALEPLAVDSTFSPETLADASKRVEQLYRKRGYAEASCVPEANLADDGRSYDIAFRVKEGEAVILENIITKGNVETRQDVVLREFSQEGLVPGSPFDGEKLARVERRLRNLRYFSDVHTELVPTMPPKPSRRNLLVEVEETETGMLLFGAGFSSTNALIGNISLEQWNFDWKDKPESWSDFWSGNAFTGGGQYFRIALRPGTVQSEYWLEWQDPWFKQKPQSFGWRLFSFGRDQNTWTESRSGLGLQYGFRQALDPDSSLMHRLRLESVNVGSVQNDAPSDAVSDRGSHFVLGLRTTFTRDRRDNAFIPTRGYIWRAGAEFVIGSGSYLELRASRKNYRVLKTDSLGRKHILSWGLTAGVKLGSPKIFERFYAGGAESFRGFEFRGVSPHDNGEPVGGKSLFIGTVEYAVPLYGDSFQLVWFTDFGSVNDSYFPLADFRVSAGVGFRFSVPQLGRQPVSLNFAVPLIKQSDDETEFLSFSVILGR